MGKNRIRLHYFALFLFAAILFSGLALGGSVSPEKGVKTPSPSLSVSGGGDWGTYWEEGFEAVYYRLLKNLHMPNKFFKTRYAFPSPMFRGVYLWDTAFTSQVWKPWDVNTAQEINRTVLDHADNGRLQHLVSRMGKSDYTQPPVMAWSVWKNYLWGGDRKYLERAYPALVDYNRWLYKNRRMPCGLFHWEHSYESGIDNSPRFGSADESNVMDMKTLAAVDLSSYMVMQNETISNIARELGCLDDLEEFDHKADDLREAINSMLWDEQTGYYYDRDMSGNRLVKIKTIASMFPLFAGVPDREKGKLLRDHIMNPAEFNTPFPLPSVARDDPTFEKDCWRGPVWINTAYMAILGLQRYGYHDEAAELAFRIVDGVYKNYAETHKLVEFYDPDKVGFKELHRKRGNLYKRITLGDKPRPNFVGWTGLANTLLIEHLIGLRKKPGKRWIKPCFPNVAKGALIKLALPAEGLELEIEVLDHGKARGKITVAGKSNKFSLPKGELMEISEP